VEGTLKAHKKYGIQLEVSETDATRNNAALSKAARERYQDLEKDADSVRGYLKNGFIPQVGPQTADRLVNHFGSDTAEALLSAKKLMAVNGIGKMKAKVISDHWKRDTESGVRPTIMYLLTEFNLSFSQAKTLLIRYGVAAPDLVKSNPYRLIDDIHGVGFSRADEIARRMGMPIRSKERLRCGITHHLTSSSVANGHTCMSVEDVVRGVSPLLSVREDGYVPESEDIVDAIGSLENMGKVHVGHGDMVYASAMYKAEMTLASALRDIVVGDHHTKRMEEQIMQVSDLEGEGEEGGEEESGDNSAMLASEQKRAVALSRTEQLLVLTGGPGTGKTFTTRSILRQWWSMGLENIVLTSPTARAARHLGNVATEGRPEGAKRPSAMTIHKLLEYSKHQNRFLRTSKRPIDAEAVVVDESSMLDTQLAASLFSAMRPGTRVLIVGDADQLPSVGPGNVLRDLVSSDTLPVVRLHQIYRQEEAGGIVRSAHLMNRGDLPIVSGAMRAVRPRDLREMIEMIGQSSAESGEMIGQSSAESGAASNDQVDCLWVEENDSKKGASLICKDIMDYVEARGVLLVVVFVGGGVLVLLRCCVVVLLLLSSRAGGGDVFLRS
jgi:exodeoxyribonuclease V alpha subunit